jgi:hypothetical protein
MRSREGRTSGIIAPDNPRLRPDRRVLEVPLAATLSARDRKHDGVGGHGRNECQHVGVASRRTLARDEGSEVRAMETMIGVGVLLALIGVFWVCFALGVYYFTRTGREGMRIQQMEAERRQQRSPSGGGVE